MKFKLQFLNGICDTKKISKADLWLNYYIKRLISDKQKNYLINKNNYKSVNNC